MLSTFWFRHETAICQWNHTIVSDHKKMAAFIIGVTLEFYQIHRAVLVQLDANWAYFGFAAMHPTGPKCPSSVLIRPPVSAFQQLIVPFSLPARTVRSSGVKQATAALLVGLLLTKARCTVPSKPSSNKHNPWSAVINNWFPDVLKAMEFHVATPKSRLRSGATSRMAFSISFCGTLSSAKAPAA